MRIAREKLKWMFTGLVSISSYIMMLNLIIPVFSFKPFLGGIMRFNGIYLVDKLNSKRNSIYEMEYAGLPAEVLPWYAKDFLVFVIALMTFMFAIVIPIVFVVYAFLLDRKVANLKAVIKKCKIMVILNFAFSAVYYILCQISVLIRPVAVNGITGKWFTNAYWVFIIQIFLFSFMIYLSHCTKKDNSIDDPSNRF